MAGHVQGMSGGTKHVPVQPGSRGHSYPGSPMSTVRGTKPGSRWTLVASASLLRGNTRVPMSSNWLSVLIDYYVRHRRPVRTL